MTALSTNAILNRVLLVHGRSLPRYLQDAAPWIRRGENRAAGTLEAIARDHEQVVDRLAAFILDSEGTVELGEYPMVFTAYHDVSFDFLLPLLIQRQSRMVPYLEQCAEALHLAPMARALVEETVGMAKGHLEMLEALQHPEPATETANGVPRIVTGAEADSHGEAPAAPAAHH